MNRQVVSLLCIPLFLMGVRGARSQDIASGQKALPMPGEAFLLDGHEAFVIQPATARDSTPWVWYAPTLPGLPSEAEVWMFEKFLDAGIAIAGVDAGESYGSPTGGEIYSQLYKHLVSKRQFSKQPVLLARSRGGLMLYSWAAENPRSVGGIAGIYPVCNIESYPGLARASEAYALSPDELKIALAEHNPIDRLRPLAVANVPIFHIHGDVDRIVPIEANSAIVAKRYHQLGGKMTLKVIQGQGHNMWSGWFRDEKLVEFVIANATKRTSSR